VQRLSNLISGYSLALVVALSGRVVLVTGGASGIGAALATKLVDYGAQVWIADREFAVAKEFAQALTRRGQAYAVELDVRSYTSFKQAVAEVVQRCGRIDYLFNSAGIGVGGEIASYTMNDWNNVFDVNLWGVVHGIQAVYPLMIAQGSGHIVNTASMAGLVTVVGQGSYAATEHAVVALSKTLRVEAECHNVQVSVLCPSLIRAPMLKGGKFRCIRADVDHADFLTTSWEPVCPMAPDSFAKQVLCAVLRQDAIIVVPAWWKMWWYLERLSPATSTRLARIMLRRMRKAKHENSL
jgi:NAD(P)-dependent dehydrogenase (short-subunit alcohol dehydrogenase family)